MADRTHSHDTSTPAMSDETVPSEEFVLVPHPGYGGKLYPAQTVLSDLAGQEGCDGEPYDSMQNVADALRSMKTRSHKLDAYAVIRQIVVGAENVASCAGVGSLETAGQIVSFLASRPSLMPSFMAGTLSAVDSGLLDHHNGVLSWHGMDGDIHEPDPSKAHFPAIPLEDLFSASTPNPSPAAKGGDAVREIAADLERSAGKPLVEGSWGGLALEPIARAMAHDQGTLPQHASALAKDGNAVRSHDVLDEAKINALPLPLIARFAGDKDWLPIHDIGVDAPLCRIDVSGKLEPRRFSEIMELKDGDGVIHNPDDFYLDTSTPTEGPASQTEGMGGDAEAVERLVDDLARWMHGEVEWPDQYSGRSWPEHDDDTGARGHGGYVTLVHMDVVHEFRDIARRMVKGFRLERAAALTPPETAEAVPDDLTAAYMAGVERGRDELRAERDDAVNMAAALAEVVASSEYKLESGDRYSVSLYTANRMVDLARHLLAARASLATEASR